MAFIIEALKGAVIGIANVIPGVSGGTMAVVMGIYDKIIMAATSLKKDFKGSVKTLLPYVAGLLVGILAFARVLEYLFDHYPLPTAFAFAGLILGALPMLWKKVKGKPIRPSHALVFLVMVAVVAVPPLLNNNNQYSLSINFPSMALMLVLGFIAAATMVIPGVSGSMMLMLLGYYQAVLSTVNDFTRFALAFDFGGAFSQLALLLPFVIGALLGIFVIAKLIKILLTRFELITYWGILGLIAASPFCVLYPQSFAGVTPLSWVACLCALAAGLVVSLVMGKHEG